MLYFVVSVVDFLRGVTLKRIFTILLYWKWTFIIPLILATAISILVAMSITPIYRAQATLKVENRKFSGSILEGFSISSTPVSRYLESIKQLLLSRRLLDEVGEALNIKKDLEQQQNTNKRNWRKYLRDIISIRTFSNGIDIIEIIVLHRDPQLAKNLANELAATYVDFAILRRQEEISNRLNFLENLLNQFRQRLGNAEQKLNTAQKVPEVPILSNLILEKQSLEQIYSLLLKRKYELIFLQATEFGMKGHIAQVLDPAMLPQNPIKPNKRVIIIIGIGTGLVLGLGLLLQNTFIGKRKKKM